MAPGKSHDNPRKKKGRLERPLSFLENEMAELISWSTSAGSNNASPPNGWPENMNPSDVNNTAREGMAVLARFNFDVLESNLTTAGSSTAFTLAAPNRTIAALYTGLSIRVKFNQACGASPTLSVSGLTAKSLVKNGNVALSANDISANQVHDLYYDGTNIQVLTIGGAQAASTTQAGISELLTQAELNTGTDNTRVPTADILANWAPAWATVTVDLANDLIAIKDVSDSNKLKFVTAASVGATAASQAEEEAASSTTVFTTPGRQHFHPGVAKCWGTVTVSAGTPTLNANYNLTSITDTATGRLTVTIGNDFSSANYSAVQGLNDVADSARRLFAITSKAAGSFEMRASSTAGTLLDPDGWEFACFGDI